MHTPTRLFLSVAAAITSSALPFISAQAQNAIGNQASAQMNQVQQDLQAGLITPSQANDLMNRYSDVVNKSQQYAMQDGGRLNTPDRLDLQGKLAKNNKRLMSSLQNNGVLTGGIASNLFGLNGSGYANPLYGNAGSVLGANQMATPYGMNNLGAVANGYGNGYGMGGYGANGYGANGYGASGYGANSYGGGGGGCHHHRNHGGYGMFNGSGNSGMGLSSLGSALGIGNGQYANNGAYGSPYGVNNVSYGGMPFGSGGGLTQGLLSQVRNRMGYGRF